MPIDIQVKQQTTTLEIRTGDMLVTIESTATLPPSYQSIISKFFETFHIIKAETIIPASEDKKSSFIKLPVACD